MQTTHIIILVLVLLDIAAVLLARWFDRRYYVPFLNATMNRPRKECVYNPNLLGVGLLAAGGGLLFWIMVGCTWLWFFHK